jgi:hypothetical protein
MIRLSRRPSRLRLFGSPFSVLLSTLLRPEYLPDPVIPSPASDFQRAISTLPRASTENGLARPHLRPRLLWDCELRPAFRALQPFCIDPNNLGRRNPVVTLGAFDSHCRVNPRKVVSGSAGHRREILAEFACLTFLPASRATMSPELEQPLSSFPFKVPLRFRSVYSGLLHMDYVTRQFIVLAKKLRDEFHKLRDTLHADLSKLVDGLKNLKDSISTQTKANKERNEASPITFADLCSDIPIRVQTESKRSTPKKIWDFMIGALEAGAFIAVMAYTVVSYFQWQAIIDSNTINKKSAEAAERAAKATENTLIATERPWVKVDISLKSPPRQKVFLMPGGGLTFNKDGTASLNTFITVKNIGHSVASAVYIRPQMYTPRMDDKFLSGRLDQQRTWCDEVRKESPDAAMLPTLMENEDSIQSMTIMLRKEDIEAQFQSQPGPNKVLSAVIYGCVNYRFEFSDRTHQTLFIYELSGIGLKNGKIPVGITIPGDQLEISRFPFGGSNAD